MTNSHDTPYAMPYEHSLRIADNLSSLDHRAGNIDDDLERLTAAVQELTLTVAFAALGDHERLAALHDL